MPTVRWRTRHQRKVTGRWGAMLRAWTGLVGCEALVDGTIRRRGYAVARGEAVRSSATSRALMTGLRRTRSVG